MEADTIVAISTPPGRGAIGVVRISGPASLAIGTRLAGGRKRLPDRRAVRATVLDGGSDLIDHAILTHFRSPRSYTGEDMVEVSCHGNSLILDRVVEASLAFGARTARPGEFTLRAFLNGRMDLSQAEAVVDLVEARSEAGLGLALRQLEGELAAVVGPLRSDLLDLLAHMTALVDYSEEDVPNLEAARVVRSLETARARIAALLQTARRGQVLKHGVSLAIVGPPNAGKSSILNRLLGRERAIVTPIAGTTRDTLEEELTLDGILFRVADTAGMSDTNDPVEVIGIRRSRQAMQAADIVLLVLDGNAPMACEVADGLAPLLCECDPHSSVLVAVNKSDLPRRLETSKLNSWLDGAAMIETCALTSEGLDQLRAMLLGFALGDQDHGGLSPDGFVLSNLRHTESLRQAQRAIDRARTAEKDGVPLDLIGLDVRTAVDSLGEILGQGVADELLDRIFSRFCIGK